MGAVISVLGKLLSSVGLEVLVRYAFFAAIESGAKWYEDKAKKSESKTDDIVAEYLNKAVEHIKTGK